MDDADGRGLHLKRTEERLVPKKTTREAGRVRIERRVIEEPEEVDVTLRHDEIDLERRPADRRLEAGEPTRVERDDTTVLLRTEERLEVVRVPWVVEEIHLRRRVATTQQQITDTVRKEQIDIRSEGDISLEQR
jgi:uncharacterized protein (TIGR02271 family)